MAEWFTKLIKNYYQKIVDALWDSTDYDWDDNNCTWDGLLDDDWYSKNTDSFYTKS